MKTIIAVTLLTASLSAFAETVLKDYVTPSGKSAQVKIRTEAQDWVSANVQGVPLLSEEKLLGLHYIVSVFYNRISTLDEKRAQYDEIYAGMRPGDVSYSPYFVKEGLKIAILGDQDRVTDFPEYAHWRGKTVEEVFGYPGDHRLMDDIDGEATRNTCLLKLHRVGKYPIGASNTFYHEFGHFIHMSTLDRAQFFQAEKLYLAAKARNKFIDNYAAQSVHEYFAQGLEAYLAETKTAKDRLGAYTKTDRKDLQRIDPQLHDLIASLIESY